MERQATGNLARRAYFLDLETSADRGQAGGAKGKSLWVMRLEALVLPTKTKEHRVLKVWRQDDVLVPGLAWQLHTQIPRSQCYECKGRVGTRASVLWDEMFGGVGVKGVDGVAESASVLDVLPSQCSKRGAERRDGCVDGPDEH